MASLIKSQIVKHLSKFTKNLSPDKIQISTLKGEGELTNLELNEETLMELMDLPTWLRLNKAVCNKVNIKIQWSKLKSQPIQLFLDEIDIEMEMCEDLRQPDNSSGLPSYSSGGRYGFGDRVVDGMYLQINAVNINFTSKAFQASLNLNRIIIQSKTPTWRTANDLQHTRISEKQRDLLLTFKEISWQTLKIEADCMVTDGRQQTTPLRLITNQSKIRLCVKKRYSDCSAVATKLQFIMDDLLWIVTDSQMKAAVVFSKHLKDSIDKANEQSKLNAAQMLQKQRQAQQKTLTQNKTSSSTNQSPFSALFSKYDISESSYHVQTGRVDVHICDDVNVEKRNRLVDGGAVGIAIMKLLISHYPMRPVGESRSSWSKYDDNMSGRDEWTSALMRNYIEQLRLDQKCGALDLRKHGTPESIASKLVERLTMLTVEDFFITVVSSGHTQTNRPTKLLMSDKKALFLPPDMSAIHVEHTEYFFDRPTALPTPCSNAYIRINPIKLSVDTYSIMWFNSFALSIAKDVDELLSALPIDTDQKKERMELRLEALMPKIVLPVVGPVPEYQHDRPDTLQIIISKVVITNSHRALPSKNSSMDAHNALLSKYQDLSLYNSKSFPNDPSTDMQLIASSHHQYASSSPVSYVLNVENVLHAPPQADIEVMSIELEQFWMEFTGVKNSGNRPVSFLESFPITIWIAQPLDASSTGHSSKSIKENNLHQPLQRLVKGGSTVVTQTSVPTEARVSVLINIGAKICAQLNHYQYCFLMRLADSFSDMADKISEEAKLHKDLFNRGDQPGILPTVESSSVILQVKEVQFAMLAKPDIHVSNTEASLDALSSQGGLDPPTYVSVSPSCTAQDGANLLSEEKVEIVLNSADNEEVDTCVSTLSTSPIESDSGIASVITGSSFTNSLEGDMGVEKSAFYYNSNSDSVVRKNTDTLFPPSHEQPVGNRITSAFSKMVKKPFNRKVEDSDNWDSLSITSGMSDDYDILAELSGQEEEVAFSAQTRGLHDEEQESVVSTNVAERPKQLVAVTVFRLCGIEVGLQTSDDGMVAKVALSSLHNQDKGNMYYEDFQAQQLADMADYLTVPSQHNKPVKVRFSQGALAADLAYGAEETGFAHIQVSNYELGFLTSTIDKLGPVFKDETEAKPLPLLIEVSNFDFELKDDAQPVYNTEWPNIPVKLHINKISLVRGLDNIFHVQGETLLTDSNSALKQKTVLLSEKSTNTVDSALSSAQEVRSDAGPATSSEQLLEEMKYLQDENRALKEQIIRLNDKLIEKDHEEFERLESTPASTTDNNSLVMELEHFKKETKSLRAQIIANEDQIDALQVTKECLTETVKMLKEEMHGTATSEP